MGGVTLVLVTSCTFVSPSVTCKQNPGKIRWMKFPFEKAGNQIAPKKGLSAAEKSRLLFHSRAQVHEKPQGRVCISALFHRL